MELFARNPRPAGPIRGTRGHWLVFALFYAVAANLPFWEASHFLRIEQTGWFCLEYALIGLLALVLPRSVSVVLLSVMVAADLLCAISQSFYISPWMCLKSSLSFLRGVPEHRLLLVGVTFALASTVAAAAWNLSAGTAPGGWRLKAASALCIFILVAIGADAGRIKRETGFWPNPFRLAASADSVKLSYYQRPRLSRAPLAILIRNEFRFAALGQVIHASGFDTSPIMSAVANAHLESDHGPGTALQDAPNVVLILVESWGLASDRSLRNALAAPYERTDLQTRYRVSEGTVPFYGPTVSGEARELCGSRMGFHLLEATTSELAGCLPHRLADQGYHALAVHGMAGHLFSRSEWYPTVGFQDEWFEDRLLQARLPECPGAFTGTCDHAIAEWIADRLESKQAAPQFVYWVTLNSHVPVPVPPPLAAPASCILDARDRLTGALCSWYQLEFTVHDSVYRLAMDNLARPTVFIVVGDHAPPFADPELRDRFSPSVVPYTVLVPRSLPGYRIDQATQR